MPKFRGGDGEAVCSPMSGSVPTPIAKLLALRLNE